MLRRMGIERIENRWINIKGKMLDLHSKWFIHHRLVQWMQARVGTSLLIIMGVLLGRAMILQELSPFAIAYFAVIYFVRSDILSWITVSLFVGSLLSVQPHTSEMVFTIILFLLIQKAMERFENSDISYSPVIVFIATFLVQFFHFVSSNQLSWYHLTMVAVESTLSFILTLIFLQAIPVLTMQKKKMTLKNEQIVCLIILLASVMTGTVGWTVGTSSVEHILSRYFILLFAFVGGTSLGASVGVITGLILSLADVNAVYQMSLLAFAGMLAGLLKEGKKIAVAFGMLLGTSILSVYIGNQAEVMQSTWESVVALVFFLLTPTRVTQTLARFIPGTSEYAKTQHDYAKRVRDLTADRVEQFSEVFRQLSSSFKQFSQDRLEKKEEEVGHFMNGVAQHSCATCWKQNDCWDKNFYRTYKYMSDMMTEIEVNENASSKDIPMEWKRVCVKSERVLEIMKQQYALYKHDKVWKKQIVDSRELVAEQLFGVSQVMEDLAKEIKREGQQHDFREEQIDKALESLGLSIHSVDIISLDEGNVEIEIVHRFKKGFDECRKMIAPLLSDIIGENITVKDETYEQPGEGFATVTFGSAKEYEIETGIAGAAKGGELLSGDSFSTMELGNGKLAVALSDGMGNGERARQESSTALTILQQLLQSGMEEKLAIKSVNSVLLLRSSDEMYATVDLALIDRYHAQTTFLKIGSAPSFIKRGTEVKVIKANNLPVGILQEIDIELVSVQLEPGDLLIMMTDGVYDAPGHTINKERWMKRVLLEIEVEDPQEFADCLLERIIRYHHGDIGDDMTVLVSRIERYQPEWASVRWQEVMRLERPKTVS